MEYSLRCECGATLRAPAGTAGGVLPCSCGRNVNVPSLSVLRRLPVAEDEALATIYSPPTAELRAFEATQHDSHLFFGFAIGTTLCLNAVIFFLEGRPSDWDILMFLIRFVLQLALFRFTWRGHAWARVLIGTLFILGGIGIMVVAIDGARSDPQWVMLFLIPGFLYFYFGHRFLADRRLARYWASNKKAS
ncbi:MAG TPA: DUF1922 domain-containing protein [Pirellulales bacterium]|jgi:uncharacterized membrane protein SirB2|nr:DUF1922 domain-containing protein [Pirellulales bacterium]